MKSVLLFVLTFGGSTGALADHAKPLPVAPAPRRVFPACTMSERPGTQAVDLGWTLAPILSALATKVADLQAKGPMTREELEAELENVSFADRLDAMAQRRERANEFFRDQFIADVEVEIARQLELARKMGFDGKIPPSLEPGALRAATKSLLGREAGRVAEETMQDLRKVRNATASRNQPALEDWRRQMMADPDFRAAYEALDKQVTEDATRRKAIEARIEEMLRDTAKRLTESTGMFHSVQFREVIDAVEASKEYMELVEEREALEERGNRLRPTLEDALPTQPARFAAFFRRGRSKRATDLERAAYRFADQNSALRHLVEMSEESYQSFYRLDDVVDDYGDLQKEQDERVPEFRAEAREMRRAADLFRPGVTVDFALAAGLEKLPNGKLYVKSLAPVVGTARTAGSGVRLSVYEEDPNDTGSAQRRAAAASAGRWLEKPRVESKARVYCP